MPSYSHTQAGYLHWICLACGAPLAFLAVLIPGNTALLLTFAGSAALCVLLAACCYSLTVADAGDRLTVQFGPLPVFHTSVCYSEILEVRTGRSSWLDGLGVHYVPGRGWIYNIHGRDCVEIRCVSGRKLRIGTDEPAKLLEVIRDGQSRSPRN